MLQCPFCAKNEDLGNFDAGKDFCLEKDENGDQALKKNHPYYYQVR